jgi:hypothetical protein
MGFAANAIGFYLQADDQLTPALASVEPAYTRLTRAVEKLNQRLFRSTSRGFGAMANLVRSFADLPQRAMKAYTKTYAALRERIKPLIQQVKLDFTPRQQKGMSQAISAAFLSALRKVRLRFSATAPVKKSSLFDTRLTMRREYKKIVQPPDFLGRYQNVPRFAKGGMVQGPPGVDKIIAAVSKGELIFSSGASKELLEQATRILHAPEYDYARGTSLMPEGAQAALREQISQIEKVIVGTQQLKESIQAGFASPDDVELYNQGLSGMRVLFDDLVKGSTKFSDNTRRKLYPVFGEIKKEMDKLEEKAKKGGGFFERLLGPARYLMLSKMITKTQQGFRQLADWAGQTGLFPQGKVSDFVDTMNSLNQRLGLSRSELSSFKKELVSMAPTFGGGIGGMAEAAESLANAGVRTLPVMRELLGPVKLISEATGAAKDSVAELTYKLSKMGNMSSKQIMDMVASMDRWNRMVDGAISVPDMIDGMKMAFTEMGAWIVRASGQTQQDVMSGMVRFSAALSQNFSGTGKEWIDILAKATQETDEGLNLAMNLFRFKPQQVQAFLSQPGGPETLLKRMVGFLTVGPHSDMARDALRKLMQVPIDNAALMRLQANLGPVIDTMGKMTAATVAAGQGQAELTGRLKANRTWFQNLAVSVMDAVSGFSFLGVTGAEVIDFIKEFNFTAAYSAVMLFKELKTWKLLTGAFSIGTGIIKGLGGGIAWLTTKLIAATGAASLFTKAQSGLSAVGGWVGGKAAGAWGWLKDKAGLGKAKEATEMVTKAPAAVAAADAAGQGGGFLGTLAKGLAAFANPSVAIGILVFGLFLAALAGFLWLAKDVLFKAMDSVVLMFQTLATMKWDQMLAAIPLLILMGPAFIAIGLGVLGMSVALALAAPFLLIFLGAMSLFGKSDSGAGAFAQGIMAIANAFVVDTKTMKDALDKIEMAILFMDRFLQLAGMFASTLGTPLSLAAGGAAVGAIAGPVGAIIGGAVGFLLGGLMSLFSSDPMKQFETQSKDIATTVQTMAGNFSGINAKTFADVLPGVEAAAQFMEGVSKVAKGIEIVRDYSRPKSFLEFLTGSWRAAGPGLLDISKSADDMKRTITSMVAAFSGFRSPKETKRVMASIETSAKFMEQVGKIATAIKTFSEIDLNDLRTLTEPLVILGKDFGVPLEMMASAMKRCVDIFLRMLPADKAKIGEMKKAIPTLKAYGLFLSAVTEMVKNIGPLGQAVDDREKLDWKMGENGEPIPDDEWADVVAATKMLNTFGWTLSSKPELVTGWAAVARAYIPYANALATYVGSLDALGKAVDTAKTLEFGVGDKGQPFAAGNWWKVCASTTLLTQLGNWVLGPTDLTAMEHWGPKAQALLKFVNFIIPYVQALSSLADAVNEVRGIDDSKWGVFLKAHAKIGELAKQIVSNPELAKPLEIKTAAQIEQLAKVFVEGHVTADDTGTHSRLDSIITLLQSDTRGRNPAPEAPRMNTPTPSSPMAAYFASGGVA